MHSEPARGRWVLTETFRGDGVAVQGIEVRIVIRPKDPRSTSAVVDWLYEELRQDGQLAPDTVRKVPGQDPQPETMGPISDLVMNIGSDAGWATAGLLVRFLASRFSTQADTELTGEIRHGDKHVTIRASGMTAEELQQCVRQLEQWIQQQPSGE